MVEHVYSTKSMRSLNPMNTHLSRSKKKQATKLNLKKLRLNFEQLMYSIVLTHSTPRLPTTVAQFCSFITAVHTPCPSLSLWPTYRCPCRCSSHTCRCSMPPGPGRPPPSPPALAAVGPLGPAWIAAGWPWCLQEHGSRLWHTHSWSAKWVSFSRRMEVILWDSDETLLEGEKTETASGCIFNWDRLYLLPWAVHMFALEGSEHSAKWTAQTPKRLS